MVPMPVTPGPDGASASICQASDPLRPLDCDGFQLAPSAEVHRATSCWPGGPNRPAAVKPVLSAVSAVNEVSGPGELNGTCCQVWPPSADSSANGIAPGTVPVAAPIAGPWPFVAWPRATTLAPLTATCWSTPAVAPDGSGSSIVSQAVPSMVFQTAGRPLCEPTETNPSLVAATDSTWFEPSASFVSWARVQLVRFVENQPSATEGPPGAGSLPTMAYPAGPEAAATADTPARSWVMLPPATPQFAPSGEVRMTGPGAPTASQPDGPCVTLVSARRCGSAVTSPSVEASAQALPAVFRHTAG